MKYTRYDLNNKKKKNERKNLLLAILGVCIGAVVIGTVVAPMVFKDKGAQTSAKPSTDNNVNQQVKSADDSINKGESGKMSTTNEASDSENFVMVQCGFYSKKENADNIKSKIQDKVVAVNLTENDKFRVIAYIGSEAEAQRISDDLTKAEISNTKVRFTISKSDLANNEIIEIINGYLKILEKLKDKEVKGVKTQEFKEWTNSLKEDTTSANFQLFKELKEGINNLPDEVNKNNVEECYQVVYKVLNNFKSEK